MSDLDVIWAGWRKAFVESEDAGRPEADRCPFCRILESGMSDQEANIVWRGKHVFAVLNAFPYSSGHCLVLPYRHVDSLPALTSEESLEFWHACNSAIAALEAAYQPHGINFGGNFGRAAGAGVPGHVHVHVLPRWLGDTNFMSAVADTRVMPEALGDSWHRVQGSWPAN